MAMHGVKYLTGWHDTGQRRQRSRLPTVARSAKVGTTRTIGSEELFAPAWRKAEDSDEEHLDSRNRWFLVRICGRAGEPRREAASHDGGSAISGVVVSADLGRPVRRATVTATGGTVDVRTVRTEQTGDNGAFAFTNLPPGEYTLSANKGGFVESIYGQRQPGSARLGTPIRLI